MEDKQKNESMFQKVFGFVFACMGPILPGMLGTGMVKVLLIISTSFGIMDPTGSTYVVLYSMADSFFYFLPVFLAWSAAVQLECSVPLFMTIGAAFCYPDIVSLMGGAMEGAGMGTFLGMQCTYLLGVPVICTSYTSSVLPILLMAPIMKWVEGFADRVSPNLVKSFLKPMLFLLICFPIALIVVGPIGSLVGAVVTRVFLAMYNTVPWLTVGILSAIMPFMVMTGMHMALLPVCLNNIATLGFDVIVLVTMFHSNIAQGAAALGVGAKVKDTETKSNAIAAGISGIVAGITEPAMYGVNMVYGKPMAAACIGAGIGGLVSGIAEVKGYILGSAPSVFSLITFIGGDPSASFGVMHGVVFGAVGGIVTVTVAFVLSFLATKDKKPLGDKPAA